MELIGKNEYRRRFREVYRAKELNLTGEPRSKDDLAISIKGNDLGDVLWPVIQDEDSAWLLAKVSDLKSEGLLSLSRKNAKHLAWFDRRMFNNILESQARDVCNEVCLRDIIENAYVQSPTSRQVIELEAGERGKRLQIANLLQMYQKEWRQRLSRSDKECCYTWKEQH